MTEIAALLTKGYALVEAFEEGGYGTHLTTPAQDDALADALAETTERVQRALPTLTGYWHGQASECLADLRATLRLA